MLRWGRRIRESISRRCSLTVIGISPSGVGMVARSAAVITVRKAWASIARVTQRCQEAQQRTRCSSSPVSPLPVWKDSSTRHRCPATRTRVRSGTGCGLWVW